MVGKAALPEDLEDEVAAVDDLPRLRELSFPPGVIWAIGLAVPFSVKAWSKNQAYGIGRQKRRSYRFMTTTAKAAANDLRIRLERAIARGERKPVLGKVWLSVVVVKPDHLSDAVNVVDMVCDVIKEAIGIDDRWFSIYQLDWRVNKEQPCLLIGISQTILEATPICSTCGLVKTADDFHRNATSKHGFSRQCKSCKKAEDKKRVGKPQRRYKDRQSPTQCRVCHSPLPTSGARRVFCSYQCADTHRDVKRMIRKRKS